MYQGKVDQITYRNVSGWVWDQRRPGRAIKIEIYIADTLIGTIKANKYRQDLKEANIGNGHHGFDFAFKKNGKIYSLDRLKIKVNKTDFFLEKTEFSTYEIIRGNLSSGYLKGYGIEIGALNNPLKVDTNNVYVSFVDRLSKQELRTHYPELSDSGLVDIDIIDNGEILSSIKDNSLDFIIANHMLEHCQNPIRTMENHLKKIKEGGILYYAVPNKRYTFDKERDLTTFDHLLKDYNSNENEESDFEHYKEWAKYVNGLNDEDDVLERANELYKIRYSIHFHVWDLNSYMSFLLNCSKFVKKDKFEILIIQKNYNEIISILQKVSI